MPLKWLRKKADEAERNFNKLGESVERHVENSVGMVADEFSPPPVLSAKQKRSELAGRRSKTGVDTRTKARHLPRERLLQKEISSYQKAEGKLASTLSKGVTGYGTAHLLDPYTSKANLGGAGADGLRTTNQLFRHGIYSRQREREGLPEPKEKYNQDFGKLVKTGLKSSWDQINSDLSPIGIAKKFVVDTGGHEAHTLIEKHSAPARKSCQLFL